MTLVEWKREFTLGIPSVDYEHEELVNLLNELHDGLDQHSDGEEVAGFLGEVYTRISSHFALEEQIMRQKKYAAYNEHKTDHEALLDEIREIMDAQDSGAFEELEGRLSSALQVWFTGHFKTHDARLHKMLGDTHPGVEEI
jgi:hemerythrin-like metal-binding protein